MTVTGSESQHEEPSERQRGMSSAVVQSCLFHSPKCRGFFQQLLNLIRNSEYHIMTMEHVQKLGGAVCTCEWYDFHTALEAAMDDADPQQTDQDLKSHLKASRCHKIVSVLEKLSSIKLQKREHKKMYGYRRVVFLIHSATNRDYVYLEYSRQNATVDVEHSADVVTIKYPFSHTFTIDYLSQYLRFLFGKHGRNIKQFAKKHGCEIRFVNAPKTFDLTPEAMTFEVKCREVGQCEVVEADLRKLMTDIQEKREAHDKKVLAYWTERSRRQQARRRARLTQRINSSAVSAMLGAKEVKQENFSVKYQHLLKEKSQRKLEKARPKPSILRDGNTWCANCLKEYSKESTAECVYHSGYIRGKYWTCCPIGITDKSRQNQQEQHQETGCKRSMHVWKPHKKAPVRRQSGDIPVVDGY